MTKRQILYSILILIAGFLLLLSCARREPTKFDCYVKATETGPAVTIPVSVDEKGVHGGTSFVPGSKEANRKFFNEAKTACVEIGGEVRNLR